MRMCEHLELGYSILKKTKIYVGTYRGQKRASDTPTPPPPELELPVAASHPMWVLGTELGRAVSILNH